MPDDRTKRGPADRSRINIHESWELEWWTKELVVTAAQLVAAVQRVGVSAAAVRKHLGK